MSEYVALYRKWRPKEFSDVVGQEHITKILKSEVMQGSVSHAYLFCGSRGTGKTTCAKILSKAVNCENPKNGDPCGECERCRSFDNTLDVVEMDAASNNGVDDVRELKERINFLPIEMKRRVYIIDEVHMLSSGAFNALLKTLEEPPEHIMFILATTELNKIPATILSRCKRFDFHRISPDDITRRLEYISEQENIGIDHEALRLIASLATGAMRDALSMLELFVGSTGITRQIAESSLGVVGNEIVLKLLKSIADKDCEGALKVVENAYNSSKDLSILCSELGNLFRDLLVMKYASGSVSSLIDAGSDVITALRDVEDKFTSERLLYCTEIIEGAVNRLARSGLSAKTTLEIAIMRLCDSRLSVSSEALLERIASLEKNPVTYRAAEVPNNAQQATEISESAPIVTEVHPQIEPEPVKEEIDDVESLIQAEQKSEEPKAASGEEMIAYGDVLEELKSEDMSFYSFIKDSRAYLDGDKVLIKVSPQMVFLASSKKDGIRLLNELICKTLGYNVSIIIEQF